MGLILSYWISNLVMLTAFYIAGHLTLSIFSFAQEKEVASYTKSVIGMLIIVTIYAVIKTQCRSYLLIVFPLTFLTLYLKRDLFSFKNYAANVGQWDLRSLLKQFLFASIIFLLTVPKIFSSGGGLFELHPDFSYYAGVTEILGKHGIETTFFDLALAGVRHFEFYHYFEFWLNSFLVNVFGLQGLHSAILNVFVIFTSLACFGLYVFIGKRWKKPSVINYFLALSILFIVPLISSIRWLVGLSAGDAPWNVSLLSSLSIKTAIVLMVLLLLAVNFNKNEKSNFYLMLLLLPIFYFPTLIILSPLLFLWPLMLILCYRESAKKELLILGVFIVSLVLFFSINSNANVAAPSMSGFIKEYFMEKQGRLLLFITEPFQRFIWNIITIIPFLAIALIIFSKKQLADIIKNRYFLFFILLYIEGSVGIVLLHFTREGHQILRNLFDPLLVLLCCWLIIRGIKYQKAMIPRVFSWAILFICLITSLPAVYSGRILLKQPTYEKLNSIINTDSGEIAFIRSEASMNMPSQKFISFKIPFDNFRRFNSNYFPACLSLNKIKLNSLEDHANYEPDILNARFYKDIIINKMPWNLVIDKYSIKYLFVENGSSEIPSLLSDKKYRYDTVNGYYIFVRN